MEACLALAIKTQKGKSLRDRRRSHGIIVSFLPLSRSLTMAVMAVPLLMAIWRSDQGRKFAWKRPCVFLVWYREQSFAALGLWLTENVIECFVCVEWEAGFHEICNDSSLVLEFWLLCKSWSKTQWGKCKDPSGSSGLSVKLLSWGSCKFGTDSPSPRQCTVICSCLGSLIAFCLL